jgi:hypothetical protein
MDFNSIVGYATILGTIIGVLVLIITVFSLIYEKIKDKRSKKEQRANESLNDFYLPVKDILKPYYTLLKENYKRYDHIPYIDNGVEHNAKNLEFFAFAQLFDRKIAELKITYYNRCKDNHSVPNLKIASTPPKESNQLLIHLLINEDIKDIKRYRNLANDTTRKKLEDYMDFDPNNDQTRKLENYLTQKTTEFFNLSELVDDDIKNYQVELNKKPLWRF